MSNILLIFIRPWIKLSRWIICCILQQELKFQTEVIERLQARVGFWPRFKSKTFHNWAKNQTSSVISCSPRTKQEMSEVIKAAFCENVGIRCAGSRHSWAPVFADSGQISVKIKNLKSDYTSQTNIRIADVRIYCGNNRSITFSFVVELINEIRRLMNCNI